LKPAGRPCRRPPGRRRRRPNRPGAGIAQPPRAFSLCCTILSGPVGALPGRNLRTRGRGRLMAVMATRAKRHVPGMPAMRTCVGCKERAVKSSLLRLVTAGDVIQPDPRARLPGRGAYLHPSLACLDLARRRRAFPGPCAPRDSSASNHWLSIFAANNPRNSITAAEQAGWAAGLTLEGTPVGKQVEKLMSAR
jgi:Predicted nucleic-acid-binding protein implicated in transcription termination